VDVALADAEFSRFRKLGVLFARARGLHLECFFLDSLLRIIQRLAHALGE
jgi:hypothetical protein